MSETQTIGIEQLLREACVAGVNELYGAAIEPGALQVAVTSKEHEGDFTVVVFPLLRASKKSPEITANELGEYLKSKVDYISGYNVIKGFLNLNIGDSFWLSFLKSDWQNLQFGKGEKKDVKIALEYCGPNTNKPLHLGHIRNMLLGYSLSNILAFDGNEVIKVNIYNDRGIAISKSMVAWQRYGNGETPESSGTKGDHLVGKYYVAFEKELKKQTAAVLQQWESDPETVTIPLVKKAILDHQAGIIDAEKYKEIIDGPAKAQTEILQEAQALLLKWEAGDTETIRLWETMNGWVYKGFFETFEKLGVDFQANYFESNTYLLGRDMVLEGLKEGVFFQKPDNSIWVDLTGKGLDQKVLLRSDGTSVYLTQDLGTAQLRYDDFHMDRSIYVVANEQDYHFKVLKFTLETLKKPYASGIYHLSYGLVELPHGRMKSREGTVVDADDLIAEMIASAKTQTEELGKIDDFTSEEANELYRTIGLGALKYFMLRVDPKKKMLFNPEESIELQGQTGPFIQYTYARIKSVLTKGGAGANVPDNYPMNEAEKEVLTNLYQYPSVIKESAAQMDPSIITMYAYNLAKGFNKFYQEHSILKAENEETKHFRLALADFTATVIQSAMNLLGINVPERM